MALSDTWGQALARVCQYFRLMTDMGRYELSVSGDTAVLHFAASPGAAVSCELCDFLVAVPFTYGVRSVDGFCVQGVRLPYPAPQHRASLEPLFGVDVQFQAEAPALVFSARLLEAPLRGRAPRLSALLANLASERLAALPGVEEPLAQFRKALADALRAGDVSLGATARRLGTTPRSLQRRLSMQGTRYADELDRARREMALVLVTQPGLTFEQIAFLLCFSEAAPFQRAFRRWTGESPGRYRERHASASR